MAWPWSRTLGVAVLLTIPVWWQGLHGWADRQRGYLEVDQIGASPFVWLASVAVVGVLLVVRALPSIRPNANRVFLAVFLVVTGALAFGNLAAALPDGISLPGLTLAALSILQVALVTIAVYAHPGSSPSP